MTTGAGQPQWSYDHEQVLLRMRHKHCRSKASGLPCEAGVTVPATKLRQRRLREVRPTGLRTKGQRRSTLGIMSSRLDDRGPRRGHL